MKAGTSLSQDPPAAQPLDRGRMKINRSSAIHCDVLAFIENLSNGQWDALTEGMQDVTRLEFVESCLGMISYLSKSTFKKYLPVVHILESRKLQFDDTHQCQKSTDTPVSPQSLCNEFTLETPSNHFLLAQIVEEVKLALFVGIERITSTKDSTRPCNYLTLKEKTERVLHERLDALNLSAKICKLEEFVETKALTVQVVKSVFDLIESFSLNRENAAKISTVLHAVASKVKMLVSPKMAGQIIPLDSSYAGSLLKWELDLQLPPDFPMKASQDILKVLLRDEHSLDAEDGMTCRPKSSPLTTSKIYSDLSFIVSIDSVTLDIVVTILESLALMPGCSEEIISCTAMDIFHKVHSQVQQFMTLSRSTMEKHKRDTANSQPHKCSLENYVTTTCTNKVILQIYHAYKSNRLNVEQLKTTPDKETKLTVVDNVMSQLNELASTPRSSSQVFQSSSLDTKLPNFDDSREVTKKVLSLEFQSTAQRKVIEVLSELNTFREETCMGLMDSFATDVVGTVVECLQDLSHILETVNSVYAHRIYQNVQNKMRDLIIQKGKDTSPNLRDDLQLIEHRHAPQGVASEQLLVSSSPLPSTELCPVESHSEINQVDVVSYTKDVIREVVKLFVLEEMKRKRSVFVDRISTPLEIKRAIFRILSQIEDPQDEFTSSTSLSVLSLSTESKKALSSKEFQRKATHAVSDVLLEERDRIVSPDFVKAATSDGRQTSQTRHLSPTVKHHISSIAQSAIHLLQKTQSHQGGRTMNSSNPSHLYQAVQDKVKAFFMLVQRNIPHGESNRKLGNQDEVNSLSVKPSPKQFTTELENRPASQHIGRKSLSSAEVLTNELNEEDDEVSSLKVFKKVQTLYIHEAKMKAKKDAGPVEDNLINEFVDSIQSRLEGTSSSYPSTSYYTLCDHIFCGHNCLRNKQRSDSSLSSLDILSLSSDSFKRLAGEEFQTKAREFVHEIFNEKMEDSSFTSNSYLTTSSYWTSSEDQTSDVTITVINTLKSLLCCTPPFKRDETMSVDYVGKGQTSGVPSKLREGQAKIKELFSLHKRSVYSGSEMDGRPSIIGTTKVGTGYDTVVSKPSGKNTMLDGIAGQPCQTTTSEDGIDLKQIIDLDKTAAKLDQLISSGEVETFSRDLACKLVYLLTKETNQSLRLPADVEPPLSCRGNDEDNNNIPLKNTYIFVEESVKAFLLKLLYPSSPSKVRDQDDFVQGNPSSNTRSGHIRPTQALDKTVDLLKDLLVNQVIKTLLPVVDTEGEVGPAPKLSSRCQEMDADKEADLTSDVKNSKCVFNPAVQNTTCSTNSMGLIIGSHTDSVNMFRRPKTKTEVKVCIKPKVKTLRINKKNLSKRNIESPALFRANAIRRKQRELRKGMPGLHKDHLTSSYETEENSTVASLVEDRGKSRLATLFSSVSTAVSRSIKTPNGK